MGRLLQYLLSRGKRRLESRFLTGDRRGGARGTPRLQPRPLRHGSAHRCSRSGGRLESGGQGRGSPLPPGSLGFRQSASALLAIRSSRAPPPPAGLCFPESKMAGSRQRGPQAGARPLFCALLLSLSHFVGGDGMGGDPAAAGATGTPGVLPHRRFEYKYSFKGPHLVQSDGTVPFWAHAGSKPGQRAGGPGPILAWRLLLFTFSPLHAICAVEGSLLSSPACRSALSTGFPPPGPQSSPHSVHSPSSYVFSDLVRSFCLL